MEKILREIGLTDSEQKVYLALLSLGDATRGLIVEKSGIAGSKVYENLQKLQEKGLIAVYTENRVKHFKASSPKQLLNYIAERKEQVEALHAEVQTLVPKLQSLYQSNQADEEVELYSGLKGFELVFGEQIDLLKRGDTAYVLGGTQSIQEDAVVAFFRRVHMKREAKGIKTRMLFNVSQKRLVDQFYNKREFPNTVTKYISHTGPVAINVYADKTIITIYGKKLTAMKITSQSVANSFIEYFEILWKTAQA